MDFSSKYPPVQTIFLLNSRAVSSYQLIDSIHLLKKPLISGYMIYSAAPIITSLL